MVVGGWPFAEFEANKRDIEAQYLAMFELAPPFAARIRVATREERFVGTAVPNFFRKPYGPGWALVGDAGYLEDPITGHGIHDAFRDAELCATALHQAFTGARTFDDAMGHHRAHPGTRYPHPVIRAPGSPACAWCGTNGTFVRTWWAGAPFVHGALGIGPRHAAPAGRTPVT